MLRLIFFIDEICQKQIVNKSLESIIPFVCCHYLSVLVQQTLHVKIGPRLSCHSAINRIQVLIHIALVFCTVVVAVECLLVVIHLVRPDNKVSNAVEQFAAIQCTLLQFFRCIPAFKSLVIHVEDPCSKKSGIIAYGIHPILVLLNGLDTEARPDICEGEGYNGLDNICTCKI